MFYLSSREHFAENPGEKTQAKKYTKIHMDFTGDHGAPWACPYGDLSGHGPQLGPLSGL